MANEFTVMPLGGFDLASHINKNATKLLEERKLDVMKKGAVEVFKTEDPDKIAEYMLENPEMQQYFREAANFKNEMTEKNVIDSDIAILEGQDPIEVAKKRVKFLQSHNANSKESEDFVQRLLDDPNYKETAKKEAEYSLAVRAPEKWKAWSMAKLKSAKVDPYRYKVVGNEVVDLAADGGPSSVFAGAVKPNPNRFKTMGNQLIDTEAEGGPQVVLTGTSKTDPQRYKVVGNQLVDTAADGGPKIIIQQTQQPLSALGKLKKDMEGGLLTPEEFTKASASLLNPKDVSKGELTRRALNGDPESKAILDEMSKAAVNEAKAKGSAAATGKFDAIREAMDVNGTVQAILKGEEILDNVKNTFGVPLQEIVRAGVLAKEPGFNFNQPRARYSALKASLGQQEKNLGAMGSFVQNINGQVTKIEGMSRDIVNRVGIRALDVPWRELNTRFIGSGQEQVMAAFMKEISAEIQKLSQGSTASVALLPETGRKEWERIHDVNLPLSELIIVLKGTRNMANIRLKSVKDERDRTLGHLENVRDINVAPPAPSRSTSGKPVSSKPTSGKPVITILSPDDPAYKTLQPGDSYIFNGKPYTKGQH